MSDSKVEIVPEFKKIGAFSEKTCNYINTVGLRPDPLRDSLEQETFNLFEKDSIMITQRQECELFESILKLANVEKCIEVGVFTGASSLSIARGIKPGGKLIAIDISEEFTNLARKYWKLAGVEEKVELHLGPAKDYLQQLIDEGQAGTFDFAYIDADKTGYDEYYEKILVLLRPGGMIAFDNVVYQGHCADEDTEDRNALALRALNLKLLNDPRVKNFILPLADGVNIVTKL
jgi:predicted O-methyltransferase YrrM